MTEADELGQQLRAAFQRGEREAPVGLIALVAKAIAETDQIPPWRSSAFAVVHVMLQTAVVGGVAILALILIQGDRLSGSPSEAVSQDGYELTLRATRSTYRPGEEIPITAVLTYRGSQEVVISGSVPVIEFGVANDVRGISISPVSQDRCGQTMIAAGQPLQQAFQKSGFIDPNDANLDFVRAYFAERDRLTLPRGDWRIWAHSDFWLSRDCSGSHIDLRAELVIRVE